MTVRELAEFLQLHPSVQRHSSSIYGLLRRAELRAFKLGSDWGFSRQPVHPGADQKIILVFTGAGIGVQPSGEPTGRCDDLKARPSWPRRGDGARGYRLLGVARPAVNLGAGHYASHQKARYTMKPCRSTSAMLICFALLLVAECA
jgi:hypothetical protein